MHRPFKIDKSKTDFRCFVKIPSQRVLAHTTFTCLPRNVATFLDLCDTPGEVHLQAPLCSFSCTSEIVCALMHLSELVANVILWFVRLKRFGKKPPLSVYQQVFWVTSLDLFQLVFNMPTAS